MPDLFETPILPGLAYREDVIDEKAERELIALVDEAGLTPFRFQQWTGKRLTRSYGWSYDFETGRFGPAEPMPAWLDALREHAASFVGLAAGLLAQALVIRYDPGAGIGWHKDRPVFDHVVGMSLGHPARLRFRRRIDGGFERRSLLLAPRSIYHLTGDARHDWEHGIAPVDVPRWSVTFRSLARAALDRDAAIGR